MIVDLNLQDKKALIVGGGAQAQKRISALLGEGCDITVVAPETTPQIAKLARDKKISLKRHAAGDAKIVSQIKPDIVIAATDDYNLNEKILRAAKKRKIIAYGSDSPEHSDYANMAVIDLGEVRVAISTGGQSPAMAKRLKKRAENVLKKAIRKEDIAHIRIQRVARGLAKEIIPDQRDRKECLDHIMNDGGIDQLIKDGRIKKAERQAIAMLREWR